MTGFPTPDAREKDLVDLHDPQIECVHEDVSRVARVKLGLSTNGRNAYGVAVTPDSLDDPSQEILVQRLIERA
jgi:hypothetical protein